MRRIVFGLVAAALGAPATHAEQSSRPAKIVIGATVPMTGSDSKAGNMYKDGIQLAFEQLSAAGGLQVGGKRVPVELRLLDDESKGENATKLVEKLVQEGADLLISTYSTALVEPQSAVAERLRVPYVAGGASATPLYERGFKYLFGLQSPVDELANALLRFIDDGQRAGKLPNPMRLALVWENTSHGKDFRSGVHEFATKTPSRRSSTRRAGTRTSCACTASQTRAGATSSACARRSDRRAARADYHSGHSRPRGCRVLTSSRSKTRPPLIGAGGSPPGSRPPMFESTSCAWAPATKRPSQFTYWWPCSRTFDQRIPARVPSGVANLGERDVNRESVFVRSLTK